MESKTHTQFPVLESGPLEALHVDGDTEEGRQDDNCLETHFLPFIMFRFGRP